MAATPQVSVCKHRDTKETPPAQRLFYCAWAAQVGRGQKLANGGNQQHCHTPGDQCYALDLIPHDPSHHKRQEYGASDAPQVAVQVVDGLRANLPGEAFGIRLPCIDGLSYRFHAQVLNGAHSGDHTAHDVLVGFGTQSNRQDAKCTHGITPPVARQQSGGAYS